MTQQTKGVRSRIMAAIDRNPALPDNAVARQVASEVGETALVSLAVERIERIIATERRKRMREVESALAASESESDPAEWSTVDTLLEEYRKAVIVEWTEELLAGQFATGDGKRVTWGKATVEQHVARIAMLTQNVRGNLDAIQRHEAAVVAIREAEATCLREAVG